MLVCNWKVFILFFEKLISEAHVGFQKHKINTFQLHTSIIESIPDDFWSLCQLPHGLRLELVCRQTECSQCYVI